MYSRLSSPQTGNWMPQIPWRQYEKGRTEVEQTESLLVSTDEKLPRQFFERPTGTAGKTRLSRKWAVVALVVVLTVGWLQIPTHVGSRADDGVVTTQYLHLIIPDVNSADSNLCKTILTAQILHYPIPIIISGETEINGSSVADSDRPRHQLTETYAWLESQPLNADDGIAILLDGPRTWFQLRPEALLHRYYSLIHRADRKLGSKFDTKIVMSAQKDCPSSEQDDMLCQAASQSPSGYSSALIYPGDGAIIGPVKDLRALLQRALQKPDKSPSAQPRSLFFEIFAEQELQREAIRQGKWWKQSLHAVLPDFSGEEVERRQTVELDPNVKYDFGIGLDYDGELGLAMTADKEVSSWSVLSSVPPEVDESMPPFWTVSAAESTLPFDHDWKNIKLFRSSSTEVAPAMINFPRPSSESTETLLLEEQWPQHWIQPHGRALYTAAQRLPPSIVAQLEDDQGEQHIFWNKMRKAGRDAAGAWTANGTWQFWEDLCSGEDQWKEVFRDDLGRWHRTDW